MTREGGDAGSPSGSVVSDAGVFQPLKGRKEVSAKMLKLSAKDEKVSIKKTAGSAFSPPAPRLPSLKKRFGVEVALPSPPPPLKGVPTRKKSAAATLKRIDDRDISSSSSLSLPEPVVMKKARAVKLAPRSAPTIQPRFESSSSDEDGVQSIPMKQAGVGDNPPKRRLVMVKKPTAETIAKRTKSLIKRQLDIFSAPVIPLRSSTSSSDSSSSDFVVPVKKKFVSLMKRPPKLTTAKMARSSTEEALVPKQSLSTTWSSSKSLETFDLRITRASRKETPPAPPAPPVKRLETKSSEESVGISSESSTPETLKALLVPEKTPPEGKALSSSVSGAKKAESATKPGDAVSTYRGADTAATLLIRKQSHGNKSTFGRDGPRNEETRGKLQESDQKLLREQRIVKAAALREEQIAKERAEEERVAQEIERKLHREKLKRLAEARRAEREKAAESYRAMESKSPLPSGRQSQRTSLPTSRLRRLTREQDIEMHVVQACEECRLLRERLLEVQASQNKALLEIRERHEKEMFEERTKWFDARRQDVSIAESRLYDKEVELHRANLKVASLEEERSKMLPIDNAKQLAYSALRKGAAIKRLDLTAASISERTGWQPPTPHKAKLWAFNALQDFAVRHKALVSALAPKLAAARRIAAVTWTGLTRSMASALMQMRVMSLVLGQLRPVENRPVMSVFHPSLKMATMREIIAGVTAFPQRRLELRRPATEVRVLIPPSRMTGWRPPSLPSTFLAESLLYNQV